MVQLIKTVDAQFSSLAVSLAYEASRSRSPRRSPTQQLDLCSAAPSEEPFASRVRKPTSSGSPDMTKGRPSADRVLAGRLPGCWRYSSTLGSIDGEVTRESVTDALHKMQPIGNPLAGSAYVFGEAAAHSQCEHQGRSRRTGCPDPRLGRPASRAVMLSGRQEHSAALFRKADERTSFSSLCRA